MVLVQRSTRQFWVVLPIPYTKPTTSLLSTLTTSTEGHALKRGVHYNSAHAVLDNAQLTSGCAQYQNRTYD